MTSDALIKRMCEVNLNECMENIDASLESCRLNEYTATTVALAYMSQAYTCAKQLQLFADFYGLDNINEFTKKFFIFNSELLENVAEQHSLQSSFIDIDELKRIYKDTKANL